MISATRKSLRITRRKPVFKKLCSGLTLVELIVAMAIMLLVLSAILVSVASSSKATSFQRNYSQLMDNGQTALNVLASNIRNAGFQEMLEVPLGGRTRFGQYLIGCEHGISNSFGSVNEWSAACNDGLNNSNNTANSLGVRFQGGAQFESAPGKTSGSISLSVQDCTGNAVTGTNNEYDRGDGEFITIVDNRFYLKESANPNGISEFNLVCSGNGKNGEVVLVSGIEQMRFWYGVSDRDTQNASPNVVVPQVKQYMTISDFNQKYQAEGNSRWDRVTAIRVCVVAQSSQGIVPPGAQYVDCDGNTKDMGNILRKAMYTTVDIPNAGYGL